MNREEAEALYTDIKTHPLVPGDERQAELIEVLEFLIKETGDSWYMLDLGSIYYYRKQYDLALKYYEMADAAGDPEVLNVLGYMWYYGRTGTVDYEKAFHYFSKGADNGDQASRYKLADMYKNGYFVMQDMNKYRQILEEMCEYLKIGSYPDKLTVLPDVYCRLAGIRKEEGNIPEAVRLYREAKYYLKDRIMYTQFFGDYNIMQGLLEDLYSMTEPDRSDLDIYDAMVLLKRPGTMSFYYRQRRYRIISSIDEQGVYAAEYRGHFYRSVKELLQKAELDGQYLTGRQSELYDLEVRYGSD